MTFRNRHAAGEALADLLGPYANRPDVLVLGMARGGVAVAAPVARRLGVPLEAFVARKLGVPGVEEVAFGALAEGSATPVMDAVQRFLGLPRRVMATVLVRERSELARRIRCYRDDRPLPDLAGLTVILVDDGLASGATLRAAAAALRPRRPARLIAAVPVASRDGSLEVATAFDGLVAVTTPDPFTTVAAAYEEFSPTTDIQVRVLLGRGPGPARPSTPAEAADGEREIAIPVDGSGNTLAGDLGGREAPRGLVVFAHGGGSSRGSYRNRYLAARLRLAGWATLRVDLLTPDERRADGETAAMRFDIDLISRRLLTAVRWCRAEELAGAERLVLFGASTGAAAAMAVAAQVPNAVFAVVSRGGRVDLAGTHLRRVRAAALLIVGEADTETWRANREAARRMPAPPRLRVVRGAGHTFEESGALGQVGELAASWLGRHYWMDRARHCLSGLTDRRGAQREAPQQKTSPAAAAPPRRRPDPCPPARSGTRSAAPPG
ncbi:MAG: phosphoribosyltransferase family protein [Gemmatimonadales bacterium]